MWEVHVFLYVLVGGGLFFHLFESCEELVFVPEHHQLEKLVFLDLNCDLFHGVVMFEVVVLQVGPFEVFFEGELVLESEGSVGVPSLQSGLVVEDKGETGADVVLVRGKVLSSISWFRGCPRSCGCRR